MDVLFLLKDSVVLMELKTGFDSTKYNECQNEKLFKEMLRKSVRLKACESLIIFEKILCEEKTIEFNKEFVNLIYCPEFK